MKQVVRYLKSNGRQHNPPTEVLNEKEREKREEGEECWNEAAELVIPKIPAGEFGGFQPAIVSRNRGERLFCARERCLVVPVFAHLNRIARAMGSEDRKTGIPFGAFFMVELVICLRKKSRIQNSPPKNFAIDRRGNL